MSDDEHLASYLSSAVQPGQHALDKFTQKVVTNLLMYYCIPWLASCLTRYSEADFHAKMADPTWDFITDWQVNHGERFDKFIKGARRLRHRFVFDVDAITERVAGSIQMKAGWRIFPFEYLILHDTISRVRNQIYL